MSSKRKQKTDKERQRNNHSVTKTLQKSENRQVGKAGKILTVDHIGRPCFGRIEKLEGWFPETESIIEIVPDHKPCNKCDLFLGHEDEMNSEILDSMCIDCFCFETDQDTVFSIDYLQQDQCSTCGLPVENKNQLYSTLPGKCNHCFLKITNSDANHSCIHCDPNFPTGK